MHLLHLNQHLEHQTVYFCIIIQVYLLFIIHHKMSTMVNWVLKNNLSVQQKGVHVVVIVNQWG